MNEELKKSIRAAAVSVAEKWPGVAEADDIAQEIWVRLLESPASFEDVSGMEGGQRASVLRAMGQQIASQTRLDYDYFTGNFFYSVNDVRALLARGALSEDRVTTSTGRVDLDEGLPLVSERYRVLIGRRYLLKERIDSGADKKALSLALTALTDAMNKVHRNRGAAYHDGPGSRAAVSNARAQAVSGNRYGDI